jgi:hypothetical protein
MSTGPVPVHVMLRCSPGWLSTRRTQSICTVPPAGSFEGAGLSLNDRLIPPHGWLPTSSPSVGRSTT